MSPGSPSRKITSPLDHLRGTATDASSPSFEFAALRWHAGFCCRAFDITLREAEELLAALGGLCGVGRRAAAEELLGLSLRYHQDETVEVLYLWLRRPGALGL